MRYLMMIAVLLFSIAQAGEPTAMDKEEAKAFLGLAQTSYQKNEVEKALDWASKSKEKFDSMDAECLKANILESQKKYTEAKSAFERAKELSFFSNDTRDKLLQKLSEIKRAIQDYEYKKQEFINQAKMAARSSIPYVAETAKADLKKLLPEKIKLAPDAVVMEYVSVFGPTTLRVNGTATCVSSTSPEKHAGTWVLENNGTVQITWDFGGKNSLAPVFNTNTVKVSWEGKSAAYTITKGSFPEKSNPDTDF